MIARARGRKTRISGLEGAVYEVAMLLGRATLGGAPGGHGDERGGEGSRRRSRMLTTL